MPIGIPAQLIGQRFGRLLVISLHGTNVHGQKVWVCRCDCGEGTHVVTGELTTGGTKSCGCVMNVRKYPLIADFIAENRGRDGCWLYPRPTDKDGYAIYNEAGTRHRRAHRAAFALGYPSLSRGIYVLHKCDTPACCRPDHLFAGTARDNALDAVRKDRHARGERNGLAKLTDGAVRAIRADTRTQCEIAADYGVAQGVISAIKLGQRWRHVR